MSNHESGSVRNYWVACGPIKKGEKGQNRGRISQKALHVLSPLQWWNRLPREGFPCFLTVKFSVH